MNNDMKGLQKFWQDNMLKYTLNKDTGILSLQIGEKNIPFGYDETPHFDMINYHWHIDFNVISLASSYSQVVLTTHITGQYCLDWFH